MVLLSVAAARPRTARIAAGVTALLSLALAWSDLRLARAQQTLAIWAVERGPGIFAGHWGWQHHLEAAGWRALEEDAEIPVGVRFARSEISWPQDPARPCDGPPETRSVDAGLGLRVHTAAGAANLHAHLVSGSPPVETYAPWSVSSDPLDTVSLWDPCR